MSEPDRAEPVYCSEGIVVLKSRALAAEGWQQRTVSDESRITELEDLYSTMGFETTTTGLDPASFSDACTSCAETACSTYLALFTRKLQQD